MEARGESNQRLRGLRLPHMPVGNSDGCPPSIRIIVAADIDLPSASALAEYTLEQQDRLFETGMLDLCIVCGPFYRDSDLLPYRNRRKAPPNSANDSLHNSLTRSREENSGLEGMFTASLSQLESIVCRVLYVPGMSDPLTTLVPDIQKPNSPYKRLTPNSRNIHQQWLPVAPGLGCAGLTFLEDDSRAVSGSPSQATTVVGESSDNDEDNDRQNCTEIAEQFLKQQQERSDYSTTLQRLQELPNQLRKPPETMDNLQSVYVTHCVVKDDDKGVSARHKEHLRSPKARKQVVVEIAGASKSGAKLESEVGSVPVLHPGSLRDSGDFCILECALTEKWLSPGLYHWVVRNVDFYNIRNKP